MTDQTPPNTNPGSADLGATGARPTTAAEPPPATSTAETAAPPPAPVSVEEDGRSNFRQPREARGRAPVVEKTPDTAKPKEIAEATPDEDRLSLTLPSVGQKPRPSRIEDAIKGDVPVARFREALNRLVMEKVERTSIGPLAVLASEIVGPSLAIAAAVCRTSASQYIKLSLDRFDSGTDTGQLAALISDAMAVSPGTDLIVDARMTAQHPPFWDMNRSLSTASSACEAAGIRALVIVSNEDFKRETNREGMDKWREYSASLQQIERRVVVALAGDEDDRLQSDPRKSSLEQRLDHHERHLQELWDALMGDELSAFVDELEKGFEASRAGRREELFRQAVINPETRNPAQASALFLGSFLPDLRRQNFLDVHQHLHLIAGANWRPRKKDKDGEIEKWDATPADFDRAHVGVTFESSGLDQLLRARIGGAAATQQFRSLFIKTGADALRLFVENGLTTFPLLATDDEKALAGLISLSEDKFRREHASPLAVDQVRREALSLAFTHSPSMLGNAEASKVANAAAIYLSELAERLPLAQLAEEGTVSKTTAALALLLEDVLEIARNCELQEDGADWLHDVIVRTAFIHPTLRWRTVFCDLYEKNARLRQRTLLTDRFWQNAVSAIGDRPGLLRDAMREAAKLVSESDNDGWVRSFRAQILSRLVTVWLFSAAAAMMEKRSPSGSKSGDAAILFDNGLVADLSGPLLSTGFNIAHRRLAEIEFDVMIRTRGSDEDAHVLERINHLGQVARVVRSTCLAILRIFLPLDLLGDDEKPFLDRLASIIDKSKIDIDARTGSFFAPHRWVPANVMSGEREAAPASSFEGAVGKWLAAMPLAAIMAERDLSASATPLASLLSRSPSKDTPRRLGQQIDAMRADLRSAHEALSAVANRELRSKADAFLMDRRNELDRLRTELLGLIQGQAKVG